MNWYRHLDTRLRVSWPLKCQTASVDYLLHVIRPNFALGTILFLSHLGKQMTRMLFLK